MKISKYIYNISYFYHLILFSIYNNILFIDNTKKLIIYQVYILEV